VAENEQLRTNAALQNDALHVLQHRVEGLATAGQNQQDHLLLQLHDFSLLVQEQVSLQVAAAVASALSAQQAEAQQARAEAALAEKERHDALVKQLTEEAAAAAALVPKEAHEAQGDDPDNAQFGELAQLIAQTRDDVDDGFEMVDDGVTSE
jgi:hypothetical protein